MENMEIKKIYSLHIYRAEKHKWTTKAPRRGCYFTFQKSGSYKHILKDKELTTYPGAILFLNNNDSYDVTEKICGDAICAVIEIENAPDSFVFDTENDKSFGKLFNSLLLLSDTSIVSNRYTAIGIMYELFGKILKEKEKKSVSSASQPTAENICRYIHKHYANPELNMSELSSVCSTEIHKLNGIFKEKYGVPCWQYVISVRIETASNLLKATDYSVSNIAELCGFSDPYYFSRAFKKTLGKSPSEYRKSKINVIRG